VHQICFSDVDKVYKDYVLYIYNMNKMLKDLENIVEKLENNSRISIEEQIRESKIGNKLVKECERSFQNIQMYVDKVENDISEDTPKLNIKEYLRLIEEANNKLENNDISLEESVKLYGECVKLINKCEVKLGETPNLLLKKLVGKKELELRDM
jgi:exodeoxyribonuclease VII small subunit